MRLHNLVTGSFFISLVATAIGAYMKILHRAGADVIMALGIVCLVVFIISAIVEVARSTKLQSQQKTMWYVSFVLFGLLTGIVYMLVRKRNVVDGHSTIPTRPQAL